MKKYTVEARMLDKALGCAYYDTLAVDAKNEREAIDIVRMILRHQRHNEVFISRLKVVKIEGPELAGNGGGEVILNDEF